MSCLVILTQCAQLPLKSKTPKISSKKKHVKDKLHLLPQKERKKKHNNFLKVKKKRRKEKADLYESAFN